MGVAHVQETRPNGSLLWMKLPHAHDTHFGMLSNLGDQGPVRQSDALVSESNKNHRGGDQRAKVDKGLNQKSVKTVGFLDGDHSTA